MKSFIIKEGTGTVYDLESVILNYLSAFRFTGMEGLIRVKRGKHENLQVLQFLSEIIKCCWKQYPASAI